METPRAPKLCTMCGKPAPDTCKRCRSSSYCSHDCQIADWSVHKLLCRSILDFATPPNPTSKRGILFPTDATTPRFVWVKYSWETLDGQTFQVPDKAEFIESTKIDCVLAQGNKTRSRKREDLLAVYGISACSIDKSPLNLCVMAVAGRRSVNFCWSGPLLVLRTRGLTSEDSELVDTDMVDFRDAVDVLCCYPDIDINITEPEEAREVQGVRVNCAGDIDLYKRDKYEVVRVEKNNAVFNQRVPSISQAIGLPVRVSRCSNSKSKNGYNRTNQEATFLHTDSIPSSDRWGWAELDWQKPAGNVILVREDLRPLEKEHVEAMCRYTLDVLVPQFHQSLEEWISKEEVLAKLTEEAFGEYWKEYDSCKRVSRKNRTWKDVGSPV